MLPIYNNYLWFYPTLPPLNEKPPTLYSILNSIVNGGKDYEDYSKIKDLAKNGRNIIFNFTYPLTDKISKEDFEVQILNHYLMRRIGFETVTAFTIQLNVKLNEIMPIYNKMFDAIENWNIFNDGEKIIKTGNDNTTTENVNNTNNRMENNSETKTISDRKYSDTPQNELYNVRDENYITDYNYDTNTSNDNSVSNGTSNTVNNENAEKLYNETITKTNANKVEILKEFQENIKSIYAMIYKELDSLFYGLV